MALPLESAVWYGFSKCTWWYAAETSTVQQQEEEPNSMIGRGPSAKLFRTEIFFVEVAEIGVRAVGIPCKLPCQGYP